MRRRAFNMSCLIGVATMTWSMAFLDARTRHTHRVELQQSISCLGVVMPASEGIRGEAGQVETGARELLITQLTDPSLKVVPLAARLRAPALEEARKGDCGRVLMMTLKRKTGGASLTGLTGRVAEGAGNWAAWSIPGGGPAGAATRGAAFAAAAAVGSLASSTRAQDELRIDYEIIGTGDAADSGAQSERMKARADGEDLLTPLMRRVAERVHATITTR
jgi:hypothetical protein